MPSSPSTRNGPTPFETDGFAIFRGVVASQRLHGLSRLLDGFTAGEPHGTAGCRRNMLSLEGVCSFATGLELNGLLSALDPAVPRPVRGILFDKTADANWRVAWHQDLVTAFAKRAATPGYSAWSEKEGVTHARPPTKVLERMVTLRLHLDDCGPGNGPLMVLPGTHLDGELSAEEVQDKVAAGKSILCCVKAGDVVAMRPLVLHASEQAEAPTRRRVLHLEYAFEDPPGAAWPDWR